jgi:Flp pilus assembly protein TadB
VSVRTPRWVELDRRVDALLERRRGDAGRDAALADALRVVAASMRAGASLAQALGRVANRCSGEVARASAIAAARIELGQPVEEEVDRFASRLGTQAAQLFAQVVRVQHRRGGDLGGPCHRLAALLHERTRLDAEARSATAQARFSARAVLAIPVLLALGAAWRAPDQTAHMLHPGPLLLASPGIVLIVLGAIVARRVARSALVVGAVVEAPAADTRLRGMLRRAAGAGTRSRASARLGVLAAAASGALMVVGTHAPMQLVTSLVVTAAAVAWPWADHSRQRRAHAAVARAGIESLLEVSIALFAAGATAHEVATLAPAASAEPLRSALAPAVHRVSLGRTIASAYASVPEIAESPQLDGWLHATCTSAELGAPAIDVLEQLLRDARSARREQLRSVAQTAGPRMQLALVLLVVPGVMWLMLLATVGGLVEQLRSSGVA